jgi:transposase-like protein
MTKQISPKYAREVRERAVRMVFEHAGEHASQWAAIGSIAAKIGCTAETLRGWVRQAECDQGFSIPPCLLYLLSMVAFRARFPSSNSQSRKFRSIREVGRPRGVRR